MTFRRVTAVSFVPVAIAVAMGTIICVMFFIFNCRYRNMRLVKMSSPNMNTVCLIGALLFYISCIFNGLDIFIPADDFHKSSLLCQAWIWCASVAFTLLYGAMFVKSWRVHRIFQEATVKRVVIKDHALFGIIGLLLVIDVIMLGIWQGVDPLKAILIPTLSAAPSSDDQTNVTAARVCSSQYFPAWTAILFIYKSSVLIYGAYLSWSIRHVTLPSMNDSPCIVVSTHVTMVLAFLCVSLVTIFRDNPDVLYASVATCVCVWTTVTLCLIFIPKVNIWRKKSDEESVKLSIASQLYATTNPQQSFEQIEEEMYHIVAENRALKKSLLTKDVTIQTLQKHVTIAKEKLVHLVDQEGATEEDKRDSGLEVDISGSSHHENECGVTSFAQPCFDGTFANLNESFVSEIATISRHSSRRSLRSNAGSYRYSEIARELDTVDCLSVYLRTSIHTELGSCHHNSQMYEYISSKQDIAGSIADNFHLGDNCETYSFINSYLQPQTPVATSVYSVPLDDVMSEYATSEMSTKSRRSRFSHVSGSGYCTSCDSLNTLENDKFYPHPHHKRSRRPHRRRRTKRGRWKADPKDKVYMIQEPREPMENISNLAVRREISSTFV